MKNDFFVKQKFDFFPTFSILLLLFINKYNMLDKAKNWIDKALDHLGAEFGKLQLGRANPALLEDVQVDQYGSMQPIKNMAAVSILDPQTLNIKPWDKTAIMPISKAISDSGLGLNPQDMGESIIIKVPQMTEERRKDITKIAKKLLEEAKIAIRNARADSHKEIKRAEDDKEISEDQSKDYQDDLQKIVDEWNKKADEAYKAKETDIMTV